MESSYSPTRRRLYYLAHRERILARQRAFREANPDKIKEYKRKERQNNTVRYRELRQRHLAEDPHYDRRRNLRHLYGLNPEEYQAMLVAQDYKCAICGTPQNGCPGQRLQVDHDHDTNQVRALLCQHCNQMLGHAREDQSRLQRGIEYLNKYGR